ncbi:MAG TPA: cell division protein CrgA [Mycobacteriales bacterium]|nr:cell division protein CrgA [Mycobacteriales bacterium]
MPKSRVRKKKTDAYVRDSVIAAPKKRQPSPAWFGFLVLGTMVVGVAWLVTYYVSGGTLPIAKLQAWNVVIGFLWIATGFALSTQWR